MHGYLREVFRTFQFQQKTETNCLNSTYEAVTDQLDFQVFPFEELLVTD